VAYLGVTHASKDVNSTWVRRFIGGEDREQWRSIVRLTHDFADALAGGDMETAAAAMNRETAIRRTMTPHVIETMGDRLVTAAVEAGCGARFTGAGGGGCLWAIGAENAVAALKPIWKSLLGKRPSAGLIDCRVDPRGVC
jgi:D-glycero-alpha-D-manno-heptose-7-phosphate kinase